MTHGHHFKPPFTAGPVDPANPIYHASRVAEQLVGESTPTFKLVFKGLSGGLMVYLGAKMFGSSARQLLKAMEHQNPEHAIRE